MADVQIDEIFTEIEGAQIISDTEDTQLVVEAQQQAQIVLAVPGIQGPIGSNIPAGGSAQQVLFKQTASNFDFSWKFITNSNVDATAAIAGTKISPSFGSQNISTTGTITGASFIPTSSTVPSNGLYLPATNQLGVAINSTERLRIDTLGRLLVGIDSAITNDSNSVIQAAGAARADLVLGSSLASGIVAGNNIGLFRCFGNAGGTYQECGRIGVIADDTHALNDKPSALIFSITPPGASTVAERMRIDSLGRVGIGTNSPAEQLSVENSSGNCFSLVTASNASVSVLALGDTDNRYVQHIRSNHTDNSLSFHTASPTSAGNERVRIDSSGRLLVGTSTALGVSSNTASSFEVETAGIPLSAVRNTADAIGAVIALGKSRGTTAGSLTAVVEDDILGELRFAGADGTTRNSYGGAIQCRVDATPGTSDMPGRLVLLTTASGSASPIEQVRIASDGTFAYRQPTAVTASTSLTLTVDNLKAKIITSTPSSGVTLTLPSGGLLETGFVTPYAGIAFDWSIINTSASNAVTLAANTGHTIVGSGGVPANVSARFTTRRSSANTFVSYRLS